MSIEAIKPIRVKERNNNIWYRLFQMTVFTIRERLLKSKLFLLLFLIYTFMVVTGTSIIVVFSDFFVSLIQRAGLDPISVYYGLVIFGFAITILNDLVFWIIAFSGANLLSDELKSRSLILYYSKPIPNSFYIISRFLAVFSIIFMVAIIPIIVMVTVPILRHVNIMTDFSPMLTLTIIVQSIISSILIISFYILFVFSVTMIVEDRGASVLIAFIIYYSSYILGFSLGAFVDTRFQIISMVFWSTSLLLTILGVPWKNLDPRVLDLVSRFLFLPNLQLEPQIYVYGASLMVAGILVFIAIIYNRIGKISLKITME